MHFGNGQRQARNWQDAGKYEITADADWKTFADVRATFRSADVYGDCTIFDVGNNKYRLIAWVSYKTHKVYIRSVLTHAEYDKDKWKSDC